MNRKKKIVKKGKSQKANKIKKKKNKNWGRCSVEVNISPKKMNSTQLQKKQKHNITAYPVEWMIVVKLPYIKKKISEVLKNFEEHK